MTTDLVPFGKHKGQPVTALAQDRDYCDWLLQQSWFVQRFPELHTIVVNNFGEPTETPEHNRLQLRFLEEDFRLRCMRLALEHYDPGFFEEKWSKPHRVQFEYELPTKYRQALNTGIPVFRRAYPYAAITTLHDPEFECHGIDVQWKFDQLSLAHHYTVEHHNTALFHERD